MKLNCLRITLPIIRAALFALLVPAIAAAATRFDEFTAKNASPQEPVKVLHAGLLGGAGTEWLAGGGIQPDGTVVLAGTSLGPVLALGLKETVLGVDAAISAPEREPKLDGKGKPESNKDGTPKLRPFSWNHPHATAFIVRLAPDLKTVKSVTRFGWKTAGLTSAVIAPDGTIYIAGPATEAIAGVAPRHEELPLPAKEMTQGGCVHTYVARLSSDGAKVEWLREVRGNSSAPRLSFDAGGRLIFQGPDFRVLDTAGRQITAVPRPGDSGFFDMNPQNGTVARGGEHHWPTGREPWRCPTLDIFKADGSHLYQFYDWGGPLVGLDSFRLVSDTAIRGIAYDAAGDLVFHAWSDGGNSVALREPTDLRADANMGGLGFSAWGAGVLSLAYVVRLDSKSWKVIGGTPWMAYMKDKNKPSSARIHSLAAANDAILFAGGSSLGLIQTGDAIGGGEPGGEFVAVLNRDASALRFSSAMPACAQAVVNDSSADGARWGIVTGRLHGKPVALFLGSAAEKSDGSDPRSSPAVNARQTAFGGGLDGYFVLIDLSK